MEWSIPEINLLSSMLSQRGFGSIGDIATELGRTRKSVMAAARRIITQQLVYHSASDVERHYGLSQQDISCILGHRKYYVPITEDPIPISVYMICGLIVTCGLARFGQVLANSPLLNA